MINFVLLTPVFDAQFYATIVHYDNKHLYKLIMIFYVFLFVSSTCFVIVLLVFILSFCVFCVLILLRCNNE